MAHGLQVHSVWWLCVMVSGGALGWWRCQCQLLKPDRQYMLKNWFSLMIKLKPKEPWTFHNGQVSSLIYLAIHLDVAQGERAVPENLRDEALWPDVTNDCQGNTEHAPCTQSPPRHILCMFHVPPSLSQYCKSTLPIITLISHMQKLRRYQEKKHCAKRLVHFKQFIQNLNKQQA